MSEYSFLKVAFTMLFVLKTIWKLIRIGYSLTSVIMISFSYGHGGMNQANIRLNTKQFRIYTRHLMRLLSLPHTLLRLQKIHKPVGHWS